MCCRCRRRRSNADSETIVVERNALCYMSDVAAADDETQHSPESNFTYSSESESEIITHLCFQHNTHIFDCEQRTAMAVVCVRLIKMACAHQ